MFLKISMSLRLFWQIQLYLNFFQHYLSIVYFIWYMVNWTCIPSNVTSSTKLWGTQCYPKFAFRSTDFRVPVNLIFPAIDAPPPPPTHPLKSEAPFQTTIPRKKNKNNRKLPLILCFTHKRTLEKDGRNSTKTWFSHFEHSKFCRKRETVCYWLG